MSCKGSHTYHDTELITDSDNINFIIQLMPSTQHLKLTKTNSDNNILTFF